MKSNSKLSGLWMENGFLYRNEKGSFGVAEKKSLSCRRSPEVSEPEYGLQSVGSADVRSHTKIKYNSEKESKAWSRPTAGAVRPGQRGSRGTVGRAAVQAGTSP